MRKILLVAVAMLFILSTAVSCTTEYPLPVPERCTIIRDDYGVPHIFADTKEGLAFGMGYAMAQDRLWQADVFRRMSKGRLAEFGLATMDADERTRALWYSERELQEMYDRWDPGPGNEHLKPMIEAYVEGINAYIKELENDLLLKPIEYVGQGVMPEPFSVTDVVAVTVLMGWRFGGTGGNEGVMYSALLALQAMHGAVNGTAIWNDLFPLDDTGAPVTIPGEPMSALSAETTSLDIPENLGPALEKAAEFWASLDEVFESLGIPTKFGSNAILISDELSATGNALLLGGPQMGYSVPQIVYEVGLHGAGINAVGMAMPCAGPFILIGVSEYGAWTSTTGASDVRDTRMLTLNPANPFQYWHNGRWVDMERRTETIYGPGKRVSRNATLYRSVYGPIISIDPATRTAVTLHTPFFKNEIAAEQGWMLFQEAKSLEEFEQAVQLVIPSHNFYWADGKGNIAYWHAGRFPVKPAGADRRLPLAGDGTQEWVRVTSRHEIPRCVNPEQGWLANWNNKPVAGWPYAESDVHWGEGFRLKALTDALDYYQNVLGEVTFADMNLMNQIGAYKDINGMNLASYVIDAAMGSGDAKVEAARSLLIAWATASPFPHSRVDRVAPQWPIHARPTYDHPGLTIFNAWFDKIIPEVFGGILPPDLMAQVKSYPSLLLKVLEGEKLNFDYLRGRSKRELIVKALRAAIAELETSYGTTAMAAWLTPVRMQSYDKGGFLPAGPLHPYMNRGTYNQIAEMPAKGLPRAENVLPPGQSGMVRFPGVAAPHATDQLNLYAGWAYKPMRFTRKEIEAVKTTERVFYLE